MTANINMQMLFVGKFYGRGGAASEGSGGDDGAEDYDGGGCFFFSLSLSQYTPKQFFFHPASVFILFLCQHRYYPLQQRSHFTPLHANTHRKLHSPSRSFPALIRTHNVPLNLPTTLIKRPSLHRHPTPSPSIWCPHTPSHTSLLRTRMPPSPPPAHFSPTVSPFKVVVWA